MKIAVFGLGYVGSVTATILAESHMVVGIDTNPVKVDLIRRGMSPVIEPKLPEQVATAIGTGQLTAVTDPAEATGWNLAIVCVGTPAGRGGQLDCGALRAVLTEIGRQLARRSDYAVVAIRSTVLPHVLENVVIPTLTTATGCAPGTRYGLVVTPEFLREGSSVDDFLNPPFTIIGESDSRAGDAVEPLFRALPGPILRMGLGEAMMVKYASNGFHALKVAFANEVGLLCSHEGVDGVRVMEAFCRDTKLNISPRYLMPGFAFGGSCLPKDLQAITHRAKQLDVETPLLNAIVPSNRRYLERCIDVVLATGARRVGVFGISFKPGTDDLRESPMIALIETLLGKGLRLSLYDRHVNLANLTGTNRAFIEQAIPHIASLMKSTIQEVLDQSELLVTGNRNPELADLYKLKRDNQILIDFSKPVFAQAPLFQI